jgi:hypothetical protein
MRSNKISRQKPPRALAAVLLAAVLGSPPSLRAEQLTKETEEAFARYVRATESRMDQELAGRGGFLWVDDLPQPSREQAYADLRNGQILIHASQGNDSASALSVPGGLIHDWTGIVFIPGVSIPEVMSVLQDYDHAARYYGPQVLKSRLLEHSGNDFRVFFRLEQVHVVTVVLDTEYAVHYTFLDATHAFSRSYSTRIAEVQNAGESQERELPIGNDHGFLWRLYSYWRFYQSEDGLYVQCTAISLTRSVPSGLGWLVRPFLETIPGDSLRFTLEATRNALAKHVRSSAPDITHCIGGQLHELKARCV